MHIVAKSRVPSVEDIVVLARLAAQGVRKCALEPGEAVSWKEDDMVVTAADVAVRDIIAGYVGERFKSLPVVAEEQRLGARSFASDEYWLCVDELDGSGSFRLGIPVFTCMFALMRGDVPVASVVIDPMLGALYVAERGGGAFCNGERLRALDAVSRRPVVGICVWPQRTHNPMVVDHLVGGEGGSVMARLNDMGYRFLQVGAVGYHDLLVASGKIEGSIFPGSSFHDTAAGHLLVEEAGGVATDLAGHPLRYKKSRLSGHVFACKAAHEALIEAVR